MVGGAENSTIYSFDGFRLEAGKRLLYGPDGNAVALKAKAFETLLYLVENCGRLVERDELLSAVWPDTVVEENNLTQHISSLRRMFGEKPDENRFIATVPGRGYQFVAEVTADNEQDAPSAKPRPRKTWIFVAAAVGVLFLILGFVFYKKSQTTVSASKPIRKIAILPFRFLSEVNRDEILETGTTQDLILKLTRANGVSVLPYHRVKKFASPDQDPVEAGRELGVDVVLVGTMQFTPNKEEVRVNLLLQNVEDSANLWVTDPLDNQVRGGPLDVQDMIVERVANALNATLSEYAKKRYTDNVDAWRLYVNGRLKLISLNPEDAPQAIAYFRNAIEQDPGYALAYTGVAEAYRTLVLSGEERPSEYARLAIEAAEKAVELDPNLAEAHASLGTVRFWFERDWNRAEDSFKRALHIDADSALAHTNYAHLLSNLGLTNEARDEAERAKALDPYWPYSYFIQGLSYQQGKDIDQALRQFEKGAKLEPRFWLGHVFTAIAYIDLKRYEDAIAAAKEAYKLNQAQSVSLAYESVANARLGRIKEAKALLRVLLEPPNKRYVPPYHIAIAYMGLRDQENALTYLEKSFNERDPKMVFLKVDHIWDDLRADPRFIELMRKMNFPQ